MAKEKNKAFDLTISCEYYIPCKTKRNVKDHRHPLIDFHFYFVLFLTASIRVTIDFLCKRVPHSFVCNSERLIGHVTEIWGYLLPGPSSPLLLRGASISTPFPMRAEKMLGDFEKRSLAAMELKEFFQVDGQEPGMAHKRMGYSILDAGQPVFSIPNLMSPGRNGASPRPAGKTPARRPTRR